jgi:hypothetical protein
MGSLILGGLINGSLQTLEVEQPMRVLTVSGDARTTQGT